MKKIILTISITLLFLVGLGSTRILHASTTIDGEYTLVYGVDEWTVNEWYVTPWYYEEVGYTPLYMNEVNNIQVDLSNAWSVLNNQYESMSFQEGFLYIEVASINNSSDGYFMYDDQYLGNMDSDTLIYSFDVFSQPSDISFDIWWAKQGSTGLYDDTGSLRLLSMKLVATYVDTTTSTDVIDVDSVYANLPDTNEEFIRISSFTLYDEVSRSYHFTFPYYDEINVKWISYQFDVSIPEAINLDEFIKDNDAINIAYVVLDNGDRVLYFQPDLSLEPLPLEGGTADNPMDLVVGFVAMNLTTMEYNVVNKLELNTITNKEANENAYLYAFFDPRVEDVLSISFQYSYRTITFWTIKSDWKTRNVIYTKGMESEVNPPSWIEVLSWPIYLALDWTDMYNVESIQSIDKGDIPDNVMDVYVNELEGSESEIDSLNLYKFYLGNFDAPLETSYDIQEVVIMDLVYVYDGVVYHASTEVIDQENWTPPLVETLNWLTIFSWLQDNYMIIIVVFVSVTALVLLSKAIKAIGDIIGTVFKGIKALLQLLGYFLKMFFKGIYYFMYFVIILIPKGIYKTFYFLITPGEKRRQQARKERSFYVGRSI